jgi:hypothetical protein
VAEILNMTPLLLTVRPFVPPVTGNGGLTVCKGKRRLLVIAALLMCLIGGTAEGDDKSLSFGFESASAASGVTRPWGVKVKEGVADVRVVPYDGENALYLQCRQSSFSVERTIAVDTKRYPYVAWKWKALRIPSRGDVRVRGRNDQALQLLVAFENGRIISYVWDANAPEGTITDESVGWPVNLAVKVIVVKGGSSDVGRWVTQNRNVRDDYVRLFHGQPPQIKGIRIQANTQYTRDTAEGMVGSIVFSSRDEAQFAGR